MFSGIVQSIGNIERVQKKEAGRIYGITPHLRRTWKQGESVSVNGICCTVIKSRGRSFEVFAMPETLARTNAASWDKGTRVNIEPSLRLGDPLSGHLVFGHIDGAGILSNITQRSGEYHITIRAPRALLTYCAVKGSIACNGVGLTIISVAKESFSCALTPYTWRHTTFGLQKENASINIEVDMLARYVERAMSISYDNKKK